MDKNDFEIEAPVTSDIGERVRTWRMFLTSLRWSLAAAAVLLFFLLVFRTHG